MITHPSGIPLPSTSRERLVPCFPRSTGDLPATSPPSGGLDDASVHTQILQVEADNPVIELQAQLFQSGEDTGGDPLIPPGPQSRGRAGRVGDLGIRGAEDKDLDELVEDDPVVNAAPVTPPRVGHVSSGNQRGELVPEGVDDG